MVTPDRRADVDPDETRFLFPVSAERHWTAQPERLHPTEVPDEQVGVQQLQLGGQLTSAVRLRPPPFLPVKPRADSPLLLSLLISPPRPSCTDPPPPPPPRSLGPALVHSGGGAVVREHALP